MILPPPRPRLPPRAGNRPRPSATAVAAAERLYSRFRRRRWLVLGITLICSLLGVAYGFRQVATYQTEAVVFIGPRKWTSGVLRSVPTSW